jgi:hypothetical protein
VRVTDQETAALNTFSEQCAAQSVGTGAAIDNDKGSARRTDLDA